MTRPDDTDQAKAAPSGAVSRSAVLGAVFLMGTSAIGPGFITQTPSFTVELGAAFACAIVLSVLVDVAVQLNVWRIIGVSGRRAQELGNQVLPGAGYLLAALVMIGGLVFNIGNVAGSGLGTDAMLGLEPRIGGALSALLTAAIFLNRRAGLALDRSVVALGLILPLGLGLLLWVAWRRRDLMGGYRYPAWPLALGVVAWLLTLYLGYNAILALGDL
jgi:Mn2+/Fe2+ NRAMP family transporter